MKAFYYQGRVYQEHELLLPINRSMYYGDGIFETMRLLNHQVLFLEDHFKRFSETAALLKMETTSFITPTEFQLAIRHLQDATGLDCGRIRLQSWRGSGGFYNPQSSEMEFCIELQNLPTDAYPEIPESVKANIFRKYFKAATTLSGLKTSNSLLYVLSAMEAAECAVDEMILLNHHGRLVESFRANIFLRIDNRLYTPSEEEGCLMGVMRKQVLRWACAEKMRVFEQPIKEQMLLEAEEVFFTNVIQGIYYLAEFNGRSLSNNAAVLLLKQLRNYAGLL
jgi:branched-chain amino acid aminotransferase